MRRAKEREMENQCQNNVTLASQMQNSQFYKKVMGIPVVKFGIDKASGVYGKVKDFNTITHKSFEIAENMTGAVVCRVTPFAQKGISIAAPSLEKIDQIAAQGLENLGNKVPVINTQPEKMMSDISESVHSGLEATKNRVTKASEGLLCSKPMQTYFDLLEFVLSTAGKTLNKVLPPPSGEEPISNGKPDNYPPPEKRAERGWWLLGEFFGLLGTAKDRVINRIRNRIDSTSSAADIVFKEAKKAVNNVIPAAAEKDAPSSTNGDSNKSSSASTKNKKKNKENNAEN